MRRKGVGVEMIQEEAKTKKQSSWGVRRILGIVIAIFCIAGIAYTVVSRGENIYQEILKQKEEDNTQIDYNEYLNLFLMSGYKIYVPIEIERQGEELFPEEIYFNWETGMQDIKLEEIDISNEATTEQQSVIEDEFVDEDTYDDRYNNDENELYNINVDEMKLDYSDRYDIDYSDLYESLDLGEHLITTNAISYLMQDNQTGYQVSSDAGAAFTKAVQEGIISQKLKDQYPVILFIQYDNKGNPSVLDYYGVKKAQVQTALSANKMSNLYPQEKTEEMKDVTFLLAIHEDGIEKLSRYYGYYDTENYEFAYERFIFVAFFAAKAVILLAVLLMVFRLIGVDDELITRIPVEFTGTATVLLVLGYILMSNMTYYLFTADIIEVIQEVGNAIAMDLLPVGDKLGFLLIYVAWFLYLGCILIFSVAWLQIIRKGPVRYLKENSITISILRWMVRTIKRGYQKITNFDFDDQVNRVVLKLVAINAVIIAIMCSIWFFGWGVLFFYSVILFFLLRNYLRNAQVYYQKILSATKEMAKGNLNVEISEPLGIFEPLKQELLQVKEGFSRAVEEEVKSQNMRNELITNVSHDLKTPLTAIITYVELLKDESISEEQRREYITTLDRKSQRLKHLIEDLFEVSKLNSNNVQLQVVDVDLVALLKQVQFEYEEKFEEQSIELISKLPQEKVMVTLDSQKTYRIFENLFGNIIKYTMPNTRAYVEINKEESQVTISLKNISQHVIEMEGELLTERFVRGDQARNTEGSGLGLAIVKSLVEKQGGTIQIIVDGDLFKTIIQFPNHLFAQTNQEEVKKVNYGPDVEQQSWMTTSDSMKEEQSRMTASPSKEEEDSQEDKTEGAVYLGAENEEVISEEKSALEVDESNEKSNRDEEI